jgi:hypothetical protein
MFNCFSFKLHQSTPGEFRNLDPPISGNANHELDVSLHSLLRESAALPLSYRSMKTFPQSDHNCALSIDWRDKGIYTFTLLSVDN